MSKSAGSGNGSSVASGVTDGSGVVVGAVSKFSDSMLRSARIYTPRISRGTSGDISGVSDFCSGSVGAFSGSGAGFGVLFLSCGSFTAGRLIKYSFLRAVMTVVATYRGRAANNNIPKTNPGKPRSCACARRCHWVSLNMLKLNR